MTEDELKQRIADILIDLNQQGIEGIQYKIVSGYIDDIFTLIHEAGYVPSHELQSIIDKAAESQNGQEVQEAQKDRSVLAKTVLHIKNELVSEVNRGIWVENGFI